MSFDTCLQLWNWNLNWDTEGFQHRGKFPWGFPRPVWSSQAQSSALCDLVSDCSLPLRKSPNLVREHAVLWFSSTQAVFLRAVEFCSPCGSFDVIFQFFFLLNWLSILQSVNTGIVPLHSLTINKTFQTRLWCWVLPRLGYNTRPGVCQS